MIKKGWLQYNQDTSHEITCRICHEILTPAPLLVDAVDMFKGRGWSPCGCGKSGVMMEPGKDNLYLFKEIGGL